MGKQNGSFDDGEALIKPIFKKKINDEYILHSAISSETNPKIAVALSNREIWQLDAESTAKVSSFKGHQGSVTSLQFSNKTPLLLYSCSLDGNLHVWDLRSGDKPVQTFYDDTDEQVKPLMCFDFNSTEEFICAGTELIREDSFLIFWDCRTARNLGGYWNSHTYEITDVHFDSKCPSNLASASVDGLINLFDLNEGSEDDALINTINVETSINRFARGPGDKIACLTGTEEYQLWSSENTSPTLTMSREALAEKFEVKVDYLIDIFCAKDFIYLVSGTNNGEMHLYKQKGKKIKLRGNFANGHSDVIRTLSYHVNGCLITGGEDGQLCMWKTSI